MKGQPVMNVDMSQAEYMEFRVEEGEGRSRIKVSDGSILEVTVHVGAIFRIGNDSVAGNPMYNVNMGPPTVRLVSFPPKLRKAAIKQPSGSAATGAVEVRQPYPTSHKDPGGGEELSGDPCPACGTGTLLHFTDDGEYYLCSAPGCDHRVPSRNCRCEKCMQLRLSRGVPPILR